MRPKEIIINQETFPYDLGVKILKLKYNDECPFEELDSFWNEVVPPTVKEILALPNLEKRRIGLNLLGAEKLLSELNAIEIDSEIMSKSTTYIDENNELQTLEYKDEYILYKIAKDTLFGDLNANWRTNDVFIVKCNCTSTQRTYFIWVEENSVLRTNFGWARDENNKINAIMSIAWTITTNVPIGSIEKIVRQGDCIFIKPKGNYTPENRARHLTEEEYRTLLVAES